MDFNVFPRQSIQIENKFLTPQILLERAKAVFGNAGIVPEAVDSCTNYNKGMKLLGLLNESRSGWSNLMLSEEPLNTRSRLSKNFTINDHFASRARVDLFCLNFDDWRVCNVKENVKCVEL